jgi:hypothetical protein
MAPTAPDLGDRVVRAAGAMINLGTAPGGEARGRMAPLGGGYSLGGRYSE